MDDLITQLADPELLTWGAVFSTNGLLFLLAGLIVSVLVARQPRLFWPLLIVVNLFGMGPKIRGYFILDEVFTGFIVLGAIIRLVLRRTEPSPRRRIPAEFVLFKLWIGYMILQACIGVLLNDDVKLVRWALFYAVLGVLTLLIFHRGREFPFPPVRQASLLVIGTAVIYFLGYLTVGAASELLLLDSFGPFARFVSQGAYWAGSAAAVFPAIIAVPAAMVLLNDRHRATRLLAWCCFGIIMVVGLYFFSRTLWLVLAVFVAISWRVVTLRRIALLAGLFSIGAAAFLPNSWRDVPKFFDELRGAARLLWAPGESDAQSRRLQLEAGVNTALSDWKVFLVGGGLYSHRFLIVPQVQRLIMERYPDKADFAEPAIRNRDDPPTLIIRTTGVAALLIDTGIIGVTLLLTTVILVIRKVWRSRSTYRSGMVAVLVLAPAWLVASNILDAMLLYLLIMPGGFVEQYNRASVLTVAGRNRQAQRRVLEHAPPSTIAPA